MSGMISLDIIKDSPLLMCVPMLRCIPEQRMHRKQPIFHEAHRGSAEKISWGVRHRVKLLSLLTIAFLQMSKHIARDVHSSQHFHRIPPLHDVYSRNLRKPCCPTA